MISEDETSTAKAAARPRAIFSNQDFEILRQALSRYMQAEDVKGSETFNRVSSLYHRLGRVG